ncbi:MAG: MlaD family protein [Bacteroidota bacterium]|nr:MlaD family protein [Bacteroidota bacterium]
MANKISRFSGEIKAGLLILLTIAVFVLGFNYIKGKNILGNKNTFYAVYRQVNGLLPTSHIYVNGMKVGQIKDIYFSPDNSGKIIVKFYVRKDLKIPKNSIANIFSSDILGSKAIEIKLGNSKIYAASGDTLVSGIQATLQEEVSLQMLPIKSKAENLLSSLDSVLSVVQYIFNKETRENLKKSFESIRITIKNIEHTSFAVDTFTTEYKGKLENILINVDAISTNLRNNNNKISNIINNFSELSDTLAKVNFANTVNLAEKTLKDVSVILDKVNKGKGSMGLLINNDSLYNNLQKASKDMDKLVDDIKNNPKRYVHFSIFGRKDKK